MPHLALVTFLTIFILFLHTSDGATLTVSCCNFASIQAQVTAANVGDTVQLTPGTYSGCAATVTRTTGGFILDGQGSTIDCTVFNGGNLFRVTQSSTTDATTIRGINSRTVTGYQPIYVQNGTLTITDVTIDGAGTAATIGGGIYANVSSLTVARITITNCHANTAGAIFFVGSMLSIADSTFANAGSCFLAPYIAIAQAAASVQINNAVFRGGVQPAAYTSSAFVLCYTTCAMNVSNSVFRDGKDRVLVAPNGLSGPSFITNITISDMQVICYRQYVWLVGSAANPLIVRGVYHVNNILFWGGHWTVGDEAMISDAQFHNNTSTYTGAPGTIIQGGTFFNNLAMSRNVHVYALQFGNVAVTITNSIFSDMTVSGNSYLIGGSNGKNMANITMARITTTVPLINVRQGYRHTFNDSFFYDNDLGGTKIIDGSSNAETTGVFRSQFIRNTNGQCIGGTNWVSFIDGCTFINNTNPTGQGGAIWIGSGQSIPSIVQNTVFLNNFANSGGAALIQFRVIMTNVTFENNTATLIGGAALGSSVYFAQFFGCTFIGNSAGVSGGVVGASGTAVLPGLTFTACNITGNQAPQGGAIYADSKTTLNIYTTTFYQNSAFSGGGLYMTTGPLNVSRSTFLANTGSVVGGALACNADSATVSANVFADNVGGFGGAISSSYGSLGMGGNTFNQNSANNGGAVYSSGVSTLQINASSFNGNQASGSGGAIMSISTGTMRLLRNDFSSNAAYIGGAVYGSVMTITGTKFRQNSATVSAGAVNLYTSGSLVARNSSFIGNQAGVTGGAMQVNELATGSMTSCLLDGNTAGTNGGAIAALRGSALTMNATNFTSNRGNAGGAVYSDGNVTFISGSQARNNSALSRGGAVASTGAVNLNVGVTLDSNTAPTGAGVDCDACTLITAGVRFQDNTATSSGGALWCGSHATPAVSVPTAVVDAASTVFAGNSGPGEGSLQAICSACGCCAYDPVVNISAHPDCVLFPGYTCNFTCAAGYAVVPPTGQVTCVVGGVPVANLCQPKNCSALNETAHGQLVYHGPLQTPTAVTVNCDDGFALTNDHVVACQGPDWLGLPLPTCEPKPCQNLTQQAYGDISSTSGVNGDVIVITCDRGYFIADTLESALAMKCSDGQWNSTQPSCTQGACQQLFAPLHGVILNGSDSGILTGNRLTFNCSEGYQLQGASVLTCTSPFWDAVTPTCDPISCPTLTAPDNGQITGAVGVTGVAITYSCLPGYAITGTSDTATCLGPNWLVAGSRFNSLPACEAIYCPPIADDRVTTPECRFNLTYQQQCAVACFPGYAGPRYTAECVQSADRFAHVGAVVVAGGGASAAPCEICDAGRYSPTGDKCQDCVFGVADRVGAVNQSECLCSPGYYELVPGTGDCVACPAGGLCVGGRAQPIAARGYFASAGAFVACLPAAACNPGNECAEGYEAYACGLCAHGYYKLNHFCNVCPTFGSWRIIVAAVVGGCALLLFIPLARPSANHSMPITISSISILLTFLQIIATFIDVRLPWPPTLLSVMNAFSALNFNIEIISPECVAPVSFYVKYQITLAFPLATLCVFLIYLLIHTLITMGCRGRTAAQIKALTIQRAWDAAAGYLFFLSIVYILTIRACLGLFSCVHQADGTDVLSLSPSDACYSPEWYRNVPLALAAIVIYAAGIPLLFLIAGAGTRYRYGSGGAAHRQPTSFFAKKYKLTFWYWELFVMARKILIVIFTLLFVQNLITAVVLSSAVLFASILLTVALKPYRWTGHMMVEVASLLGCLSILFLGLVVNAQNESATNVADYSAVVLLFLTVAIGAAVFVYEIYLVAPSALATFRVSHSYSSLTCSSFARQLSRPVAVLHLADKEPVVSLLAGEETLSAVGGAGRVIRFDTTALAEGKTEETTVVSKYPGLPELTHGPGSLRSQIDDRVRLWCSSRRQIVQLSGARVTFWEMGAAAPEDANHSSNDEDTLAASGEQRWSVRLRGGADGGHGGNESTPSNSDVDESAPHVPVAVVMDAVRVVVCARNFTLTHLDARTGAVVVTWALEHARLGATNHATTVHLLKAWICVGSSSGRIYLCNTQTNETRVMVAHSDAVTCLLDWSGRLVSGSLDGTIRIWDLTSGEPLFTFASSELGITCMARSTERLWAGTQTGAVLGYDLHALEHVLSHVHATITDIDKEAADPEARKWRQRCARCPCLAVSLADAISLDVLGSADVYQGLLDEHVTRLNGDGGMTPAVRSKAIATLVDYTTESRQDRPKDPIDSD